MPKNKIVKKDLLDRFYTNPKIAEKCYDKVLPFIENSDVLVEPSAGGGAFLRCMRDPKLGYDLEPNHPLAVKADWLKQEVPQDCIIVGNPPFGERNVLTKQFIRHSLKGAKCIAFVLPAVFRKGTYQKVFPSSWALAKDYTMPPDSFLLDGEPYHVPTCFQIWLKKEKYKERYLDQRESLKPILRTEDFEFSNKDPTHFVFGSAPKTLIAPSEVKPNNRGYYLKSYVENIENIFFDINWESYSFSSVSGGAFWLTRQEIINAYLGVRGFYDQL